MAWDQSASQFRGDRAFANGLTALSKSVPYGAAFVSGSAFMHFEGAGGHFNASGEAEMTITGAGGCAICGYGIRSDVRIEVLVPILTSGTLLLFSRLDAQPTVSPYGVTLTASAKCGTASGLQRPGTDHVRIIPASPLFYAGTRWINGKQFGVALACDLQVPMLIGGGQPNNPGGSAELAGRLRGFVQRLN